MSARLALEDSITEETRREVRRRLGLDAETNERLAFFPVRHHSPTCSAKLEQFLPRFRPDVILIEAPSRFEEQLEALLDPENIAPIALVAQTSGPKARFYATSSDKSRAKRSEPERPALRSYYPFCDYSPELVALRYAAQSGAEARFIDRLDQGLGDEPSENDALGERLGGAPDAPLLRSRFTQALAAKTGCRDFDELWEVLFEQGGFGDTPEQWAEGVGAYALATRSTYTRKELETNGTIARERFMAAKIAEALARGGRVLVIAGAVHAIALGDARHEITRRGRETKDDADAELLLVPYTFPRLDALLGYAPGMSGPGFYQHVWEARHEPDPFAKAAEKTLLETIAIARAEGDVLGPADAIAALAFAHDLARLRQRPRIGRMEVIEAATSCLVKGELEAAGRRVLAALTQSLRGSRVGRLGPKAGPSPLALDFRRKAETLGLLAEGSRPLPIALDLGGSFVDKRRSFFLHRTTFLALGFAKQLAGPDAELIQGGSETKERWSVAYVPEIDTRLAELAAEGASVEEAASRKLSEEARRMQTRPAELASLIGRAVLMGLEATCRSLVPELERALGATTDPLTLLRSARRLRRIAVWRARLVREPAPWLDELSRLAYERGLSGLSWLTTRGTGRVTELLALLMDLRDATLSEAPQGPARGLVESKLEALRSGSRALSPLLLGALDGLLFSLDALVPAALGKDFHRVATGSDSPDARGQFLEGLLALCPFVLSSSEALLEALITSVTAGSFESFLAALPALRRALGRLDARELEAISARAAAHLHLRTEELAWVTPLPPSMLARLSTWEKRFLAEEAEWAGPSPRTSGEDLR